MKNLLAIALFSAIALTNFACSGLTPEQQALEDECLARGGIPRNLADGHHFGGAKWIVFCDFIPLAKTIHDLEGGDYFLYR